MWTQCCNYHLSFGDNQVFIVHLQVRFCKLSKSQQLAPFSELGLMKAGSAILIPKFAKSFLNRNKRQMSQTNLFPNGFLFSNDYQTIGEREKLFSIRLTMNFRHQPQMTYRWNWNRFSSFQFFIEKQKCFFCWRICLCWLSHTYALKI